MADPNDARPGRTYRAFVSYSHADRAVGAKLFRRLDGYRVPKALVGTTGAFGPLPAKLYPCFRDREELSAARDVKTTLDEALAASEHLVVLCSHAAARSEWIAHEIRSFAALKGAGRIHAALHPHEPNVPFPPAFAEVGLANPLAADLRRNADGWGDGVLKTVAAVLGAPFADLKNREQARTRARQRMAMSISALFATVLVGGSGAGWVALDRSEQLQQVFIGVMRQLSERAQNAFDQQGVTMSTSDVARELDFARGLTQTAFSIAPDSALLLHEEMRLSIVYARQLQAIGDTYAALLQARQVAHACDKLGTACHADAVSRRLAAAGLRVESEALLATTVDEDEAFSLLQRSAELLEDADDAESRREYALTLQGLGTSAIRRADYADARRNYLAASAITAELAAAGNADPDLAHDQIVSLQSLGDIAFDTGDEAGAYDLYTRVSQLAGTLHSASLDYRSARTIYVSHDRLGLLALRRGDLPDASEQFGASAQAAQALSLRDPGNARLQRDIQITHLQLARVQAMQGQREQARESLRQAEQIASRLITLDPANVDFQADRARAQIATALLNLEGDWTHRLVRLEGRSLLREADRLGIRLDPFVRDALMAQRETRLPPRQAAPQQVPP